MTISRRSFVRNSIIAAGVPHLWTLNPIGLSKQERSLPGVSINPWIELSRTAYLNNARAISEMAGGRPVLAVLKNNAYGLGDTEVARILDHSPHVSGVALVKDYRALALRKSGFFKPILLMGDFDDGLWKDLIKSRITLAIHSEESRRKIIKLAGKRRARIPVALYIDTGLGRMGMPYHRALKWAEAIANDSRLIISGTFSTLTTPHDFALEQIARFKEFTGQLKSNGVNSGHHHLAPSYSMLDIAESHMDMVRPGILLHGSFPLVKMDVAARYSLHPTFRLRARVIRVERLRAGDSIGFSRFYTAKKDEWIATIPIGWADGYDSRAENGAVVLVGDSLYRVVNVNGSHCNLLLGQRKTVSVGEIATLIGPDRPEITPEGFAKRINGHNYLQIQYKESIPKYVQDSFL